MNFLDQIIAIKNKEVASLYQNFGIDYFIKQIKDNNLKKRSLKDALMQNNCSLNLIAEIKRASPSKGIIRSEFDFIKLAQEFEAQGAVALSVLTETEFFLGDPKYITQIRPIVQIPILRKDFIIDVIQIYQAKAIGADAILLIKAILTNQQVQEFVDFAQKLDLEVLCEIHNFEELIDIKNVTNLEIIGINNRNLKTFEVDTKIALKLLPEIRKIFNHKIVCVAESGYKTSSELLVLQKFGFNGVLIGEGLVNGVL